MKSTLIWALVVINAVLLSTFLSRVTRDNAAIAQPVQQRRMGDYLTIAGDVNGGDSGVVYVLDTSNELLGAMAYDDAGNKIDVMPAIDLRRIFEPPPPVRGK
ncbi:MAG TPA: hypothetical protein VHS31_12550 [Tepidisphaeraceae bacterium]|jgi:hypothetical protein|nr:hypothetical protein [Tepidisphaeraceae bacterium]